MFQILYNNSRLFFVCFPPFISFNWYIAYDEKCMDIAALLHWNTDGITCDIHGATGIRNLCRLFHHILWVVGSRFNMYFSVTDVFSLAKVSSSTSSISCLLLLKVDEGVAACSGQG